MKAPVLAIAFGKGKGPLGGDAEPDEGSPQEEDSDERDSFDVFADKAGIPDEKRDDAYDALTSMIEACVARAKSGGYGKEAE